MKQRSTGKPVFEKVIYPDKQSYIAYYQRLAHLEHPWHFHPDMELVLITKGFGKRFVGDNISPFQEGDLVLLGSNLPHVWINDPAFYSDQPGLISESIVIQLDTGYFSPESLTFPELQFMKQLIGLSRFGVSIEGKNNREEIISLMHALPGLNKTDGLSKLFLLLAEISKNDRLTPLAGAGYINSILPTGDRKLRNVYEYVMNHYLQPINLTRVAEVANMNPSAFCRYFRQKTGKTFTVFINNLRAGYAGKLLSDPSMNIAEICYESGFQSISNFNKQFKKHYGVSPGEFRENQGKRISGVI